MNILVDINTPMSDDTREILIFADEKLDIEIKDWDRGMPLRKDDIVYAGNNVYGKNVANNTVELAKLLNEKVYDNYDYGYEIGENGEKIFVNPIFAFCEMDKMLDKNIDGTVVYSSRDYDIVFNIQNRRVDRRVHELEHSYTQSYISPQENFKYSEPVIQTPCYDCYISEKEWSLPENQQIISDIARFYSKQGIELKFYFGKDNMYEMATKLYENIYNQSSGDIKMELLDETLFKVKEPLSAVIKVSEHPGYEFVYNNDFEKITSVKMEQGYLTKKTLTQTDLQAKIEAENTKELKDKFEEQEHGQYKTRNHGCY